MSHVSIPSPRRRPSGVVGPSGRGFTLIELLVVLAVGAILVTLISSAASTTLHKTKNIQCLSKMRGLGTAVVLYTQDHNGDFPRSGHSAFAHQERGWVRSLTPYLDGGIDPTAANWPEKFNQYFRCPADSHTSVYKYSYAQNVYFELDPDGDDYPGAPATWRKIFQVPHPAKTVYLAEGKPTAFADHAMCHMWHGLEAAENALDGHRHGKTSNYLFVDGHVESLQVKDTFDPAKNINRWNPGLAGGE